MELSQKVKILAESAKYDASCSSSGSGRKNVGKIGNGHISGICHSWSSDGRCISLLKILMSNCCIYDCAYCVNRRSNDVERASFTPEELANLVIEFYKRNYIEGLFLSSAVIKNADYTMELFIKTLRLLRYNYGFCGYIHVKAIPGSSSELVRQAGMLADRISVNIELPSEKALNMFAPQKSRKSIVSPMQMIKAGKEKNEEEKKKFKNAPAFAPAGQTTQMIIGASADSDLQIMRLTQGLYDSFSLKRVYYSAYIPVGNHPVLPGIEVTPPLVREHRLYQADWLLRFYKFRAEELLDEYNPNFSEKIDPKCAWALRNPQIFPINVNTAPYEMILRVPGIGVKSALRIISARTHTKLTISDLKRIGVVMKRAKYFIDTRDTCDSVNALMKSPKSIEFKLQTPEYLFEQLSLFSMPVV